jgi:hypothetical protein
MGIRYSAHLMHADIRFQAALGKTQLIFPFKKTFKTEIEYGNWS